MEPAVNDKSQLNGLKHMQKQSKNGSESNLVYADIDIEHLETASKPSARQKPPSPTKFAGVDFIRTERGSNSDNIIT
ncbi:hypothetical protein MAR_028773 [Mya arenaria]|uniref:Uncharacterized protein n=1 Tax=Mya arenaria TaxID=6604 RepID=A0ABY7DGL9_MYAAR|nr:hypothetical protein MAR_028773 [Mya arenaria]